MCPTFGFFKVTFRTGLVQRWHAVYEIKNLKCVPCWLNPLSAEFDTVDKLWSHSIRIQLNAFICLSVLQLLQVFSYSACLGQQKRTQQVIPISPNLFCSGIISVANFDLWLFFSFCFILFSEKQFWSEACRSVWNVGERTWRRTLHFSQLPKQIPSRHRVCLHPWR